MEIDSKYVTRENLANCTLESEFTLLMASCLPETHIGVEG